uniref:UvrABC system protein C n=1 Tax=Candidatus Kentrum sp. FM TaxID=2126340 RepID=A0A450TNN7_9GAMM|nr:MAG: excinuclease ABC subunit C [Candidatus Kentron sp. FM]VFJ69415.1 MAG: excinuclease ABC subunit C [Candidatus Kentron sp. FM]VFK17139.1 MAG: excinuclease ABC subunit C [Candidatus Kentron sp. FM]
MANTIIQDTGFDPGAFLACTPNRPGVYRMLGAGEEVLYVGKAGDLKKRLASYFRAPGQLSGKLRSLISRIQSVDITVTHTETEALLLENNLIKSLHPRYNILLRDDKSYPYLYLSGRETFPGLAFHRGPRQKPGRYFGPFPSASAVRETLQLLQKLFRVRQCEDSFFRNRSRPCLQYQIGRCTAPCVGLVDEAAYAEDVEHTSMFLEGKDQEIIERFVLLMDEAAKTLRYELAARYRDNIRTLRHIQEHQHIDTPDSSRGNGGRGNGGGSERAGHRDIDIVAAVCRDGVAAVQVFFIRSGRNLGNKTFFPHHAGDADAREVLTAFLPQYYLAAQRDAVIPERIFVNEAVDDDPGTAQDRVVGLSSGGLSSREQPADCHRLPDDVRVAPDMAPDVAPNSDASTNPAEAPSRKRPLSGEVATHGTLEAALSEHAGKKITIIRPRRGEPVHWLQMAVQNAELALARRLVDRSTLGQRFEALQAALDLGEIPERIECFDVSHISGDSPVASCVVFGTAGPIKSDYRHFTLRDIEPGDDYAGLKQALRRRYTRVQKEGARLPDLLLIDGGKGQLAQAVAILTELQISGVLIVGVAKGPDRKPGLETLFLPDRETGLTLPADSGALHLIGQIRDEAHRFAVAGHRAQRARARNTSVLEQIPGVGAKRRRQLLNELGGLQGIKRAGIEDLAKVRGISHHLAKTIYQVFHEQ